MKLFDRYTALILLLILPFCLANLFWIPPLLDAVIGKKPPEMLENTICTLLGIFEFLLFMLLLRVSVDFLGWMKKAIIK